MKEHMTPEELTALKMFLDQKPVREKSERTQSMYIRLSPEEKRHIELVASAAGLTTSELVRQCTMNLNIRSFPPGAFYDLMNACDNIQECLDHYHGSPVQNDQLMIFAEGLKDDLDELKRLVWFFHTATDEEFEKWDREHPFRRW